MRFRTVLTAVVLASILAASVPAKAPMVVWKAPDFTLTDIDGNAFTLSDHRGRVVLIDFCALSAVFCIQMHGTLKEVRDAFTEEELVMISIFRDTDTDDDIRDFRDQYGGDWTYARGTEDLNEAYSIRGFPHEFIVGVNGYVQYERLGLTQASVLSEEIEGAKTGYSPPVAEIPYALVAMVIIVVVAAVAGTVGVLLWRRRRSGSA